MIYVIDDDEIMCECIARACGEGVMVRKFSNAIEAMDGIASGEVPDLVFLDVLLDGPDGFTFLNELVSYTDTAKIPVVIATSLDLKNADLVEYGVVGVMDKAEMLPQEILGYVRKHTES